MSISKIFIPDFVCVLTNERYKTYQTGFYSVACVMPQGHWGPRGSFFSKHGHVAYQIDGDDEHNRIHVKFSSKGQTGDIGRGHKVKYL